jgi:hypothetical protein
MLMQSKPMAVMGSDLDLSLVRGLEKGDKVLLEMNGVRVPNSEHPFAAEEPWRVLSNDSNVLRLKHRTMRPVLDLPYENLHANNPATFRIYNSAFGLTSPIYCILQFVSYYAPVEEVEAKFQSTFNRQTCLESLEDDRVRNGLIEKLQTYFAKFTAPPFAHKSIKRFALRCHVQERDLVALRDSDWMKIADITDEALCNILQEVSLFPHLLDCGKDVGHDLTTIFEPTGSNG